MCANGQFQLSKLIVATSIYCFLSVFLVSAWPGLASSRPVSFEKAQLAFFKLDLCRIAHYLLPWLAVKSADTTSLKSSRNTKEKISMTKIVKEIKFKTMCRILKVKYHSMDQANN